MASAGNNVNRALRLGLVGLGKIARDQHLPAIAANPSLQLAAVASPNTKGEVPSYPDVESMLGAEPSLDAVAMCQPPQFRFAAAHAALLAGKHVFLEKPPGATLSEVEALISLAAEKGLTLFASWHSREAAAVGDARRWLSGRAPTSVRIAWKEDVRVWHPGQTWIWQPGGFGVFDPGINALSILTSLLPEPVRLMTAEFDVPENCHAPSAGQLVLETASGVPIAAEFDFLQTGPQSWDIIVDTAAGVQLRLAEGGNRWFLDGEEQPGSSQREYPALYERFVDLIHSGTSDVDLAPLRLVADAFLIARIRKVAPFVA
jgi:D-galactose 1-dehydrogenase